MKTQILVKENLVFCEGGAVEYDCSIFADKFVFCEINESEKWVEQEPFKGRVQPEDWGEIEAFINEAKVKMNKPNSYSIWDESSKSWLEDENLKTEFEKAQKKALKQTKLENLTVTTQNGNTFDGNETARNNMLSAIQSAEFLGKTEHSWKMADNSVVLINLSELKEALALAIKKVGEIVTNEE